MRKRKTFVAMALLIAVLVLGVGYAAVQGVTLTLNGSANVKANADFSVEFTGTTSFSTEDKVTGVDNTEVSVVSGSASDITATMTVNLDATHKEAYAIYEIQNTSAELNANIAVTTEGEFTDTAKDYLTVSSKLYSDANCNTELGTTEVAKETGTAYLKVTVSLTKLPVEDIKNATFTVTLDATPASTAVGTN